MVHRAPLAGAPPGGPGAGMSTQSWPRMKQALAAGSFVFRFEPGEPIDQAHVLQAAGALFDIRLRVLRRILKPGMAGARQFAKTLAHLLTVQRQRGRQFAREHLVDRGIPRQKPPIQQAEPGHARPLDGLHALGHREHRGVHPQTRVPKQADHLGQPFLELVGPPCRFEQEHDVQLGVGKCLAQPISAARQHRQRFREERQNRGPAGLDHQLIYL